MHPIEEKLLTQLKISQRIDYDDLSALNLLPLGTLSQEFYSDPSAKQYSKLLHRYAKQFGLRLALEEYLSSDHSNQYLENIEILLHELPSPISMFWDERLQNKAAGTYLTPVSTELIRRIYQLGDSLLVNLFKKHFSVPPIELFEHGPIPDVIQQRETDLLNIMKKFDIKSLEPFIIKVQRHIRMKKRYQEEIHRIAHRDEVYLKYHHMSTEELNTSVKNNQIPAEIHEWAEELLQDANKPYKPKCAPKLSDRIMTAAKKIAAFSTVKHITSEKAMQSIFDDALYGRRALMDFYLSFDIAALGECDILNGDANVACLGPQDIDPKANGGIIIEFDLPKLIKNKPSAFFKQRDLEYRVNKIRQVQLGSETISFDHTGHSRSPTSTYLKIVRGLERQSLKQIAEAPKSSFIAYNLEQMHEILTLNFFRFMDRMTHNGKLDQAYIDNFYKKVDELTDEEMVIFLTNLEKQMTDTAEFNFYGAHQIDFSTIINITARYKGYTLNLPKFINELKQGNIEELRYARTMIPELFQSYRFIDYLLLEVQSSEVRYYLNDLRKQCKTPNWVEYTPLSVPKGFDLHWEIRSERDIHEPKVLVPINIEKEKNLSNFF